MTDNITLPRAVIEQVREALKELDYASEPYVNEIARTALAALDAALAEPKETFADSLFRRSWEAHRAALAEPKKERAETGIPARGEIEVSTGKSYREHVTDGSPCWCNPELNYRDPETGAEVWVHRREQ